MTIQTVQWELQAAGLEAAKDWQDKVSAFSSNRLPALLENAFAPYPSHEAIVIERIELELETVRNEAALAVAVEEALSRFLQQAPAAFHYPHPAESNQHFLTALRHYLLHGSLAWPSKEEAFDDDAALLAACTANAPQQIISALAGLGEAGLLRFLRLFNDGQNLQSLLLHLSGNAPELASFFRWLSPILARHGSGWGLTRAAQNLLAHYAPLQVLLSGPGLQPDALLQAWWKQLDTAPWLSSGQRGQIQAGIASEAHKTVNHLSAEARQWHRSLLALLHQESNHSVEQPSPFAVRNGERNAGGPQSTGRQEQMQATESARKPEAPAAREGKPFFIGNGGIILLYPYCKTLFGRQGWLDENGWLLPAFKMTAARLLQFIACGHEAFKEYHLVLNKALCGISPDAPVEPEELPFNFTKADADALLQTLISRWEKIGNTSPDGLRGSFLLRKARLVEEDRNWLLHVERKGWDLLLDKLPYPLGLIKLPWMLKPIVVQW